jgi:transcriptional regulator with XRE-family HTH domain
LERGVKSPTLRVFRSLAEALGTSGSELLRRAEPELSPLADNRFRLAD